MNDWAIAVIVTVVLFGVFLFGFSVNLDEATEYRIAIEDCEKSLPRDQQCKVIGVVE